MSDTRQPNPQISEFLENLRRLGSGERALFKRRAGMGLAESPDVLGLFFRVLPRGVASYQEATYFAIATLYPLVDEGGGRQLWYCASTCKADGTSYRAKAA